MARFAIFYLLLPVPWRDRVLAISDSWSPVQTRLSALAYLDDADLFAAREDPTSPPEVESVLWPKATSDRQRALHGLESA